MGKYNLDDILGNLGGKGPLEPKRSHSVDKASDSFSPVPAMPANQGITGQGASDSVDVDPAVKVKPVQARASSVGATLVDLYTPDTDDAYRTLSPAQFAEKIVELEGATSLQVSNAQKVVSQSPGRRLVEVLIEQGAEEERLQPVIAQLYRMPFERVNLELGLDGGFDGTLLQRLGADFCKENQVIPLRREGQRIVIGTVRPDDVFQLSDVARTLGVPIVKPVLVTGFDIRGALELVGVDKAAQEEINIDDLLSDVTETDVEVEAKEDDEVDLEKQGNDTPVIRYVNHIINTAIKEGASDIHVEPAEKKLKVRFRIDGELYEMMQAPPSFAAPVTSRLKIMANLDISERRVPQDGRIRCTVAGRKLDLRVSTLPTAAGEKTVMRILDTRSINVQLEDLGFSENAYTIWKTQINRPHGIVLVTGPTGSGKTTTLYSSLRQLDKNSMNISTVEDPVEYHLDGITQTQTHDKIGMTFARALKALLRQDPDVIMLGEIRDSETAITAVQAALTGHLVLSTLHTNDAPSSITRLINIGLEPFLVGAALNGVLAQRLLRKLCTHCKHQGQPTDEMREYMELQGLPTEEVWLPKGCDRCRNTGYSGRVGIYELLTVDDGLRDIIARNPNVAEFRRMCIDRGMVTLRADGMDKVRKGVTTVEEVLRVTGDAL